MIVLIKGKGDKSNRLLQHAHLWAFCLEYKLLFYNPTLWNLSKYYHYRHSKLNKVILVLFTAMRKFGIRTHLVDFNDPSFNLNDYKEILMRNLVFVSGWHFRVPGLIKKHRLSIVREFSIEDKWYQNNPTFKILQRLREKGFTIVGVHIRRGDYRQFRNGQYYYSDETYKDKIAAFRTMYADLFSQPVKFVIFSNERLIKENFSGCIISKNKWFVDHHLMSVCDYLLGPPSTFTAWSSFIGNVPLMHLYSKNADMLMERFSISDLETPIL